MRLCNPPRVVARNHELTKKKHAAVVTRGRGLHPLREQDNAFKQRLEKFQLLKVKKDKINKNLAKKKRLEQRADHRKNGSRGDNVSINSTGWERRTFLSHDERVRHKKEEQIKASLALKRQKLLQVKKHFVANERFNPIDHGILVPKHELELEIEQAIIEGDHNKATEMSDLLADTEYQQKIDKAIQSVDSEDTTKEEMDIIKKKKGVQLHWGFEEKKRWESKGNM